MLMTSTRFPLSGRCRQCDSRGRFPGSLNVPSASQGREAVVTWGRTRSLHASPSAVLQLAESFQRGSITGRSALLGRKQHLRASATSSPSDSEGEVDAAVFGPPAASAQEVGKAAIRRGRPPGGSAWNKGRTLTEEARSKISQGQQLRHKNASAKSGSYSGLAGKGPWNKGLAHSEVTRARMSASHTGLQHRKATRAKMSATHMGMEHSQETVAKVSAKLTGVPKSPAHKAAIAATMRRRHAAVRVLRAVEGVHRQHGAAMSTSSGASSSAQMSDSSSDIDGEGASDRDGGGGSSSSSGDGGGVSSRRIPSGIAGSGSLGSSSGSSKSRRLSKGQILNGYKAQLQEYRALKEELGPWTAAFAAKHDRKPRLVDVERTGVEWLIHKYKLYIMLRERLLMDTPHLRGSITKARSGPESINDASFGGKRVMVSSSMPEPMNANTSTGAVNGSGQDASVRMSRALQYKAARAVANTAEVFSEISDDVTGAAELKQMIQRMQSDGTDGGPSASGEGGNAAGGSGSSPPSSAPYIQRGLPDSARRPIKSMPVNAPQRVQSAMQAALEYRQRQKESLTAKSSAAADAAQAPPAKTRANVKRPEALERVLAAARAAKAKKAQPPPP